MVVIQNDAFNASPIRTVLVCALTSNLARANAPGNVRLRKGEGGLPRPGMAAEMKGRGDYVTATDRRSEAAILNVLAREAPGIAVVADCATFRKQPLALVQGGSP